jgi:hypothetical protein
MYQRWHKHGESYLSKNRCPPSVLEEDITGNRMKSMIIDVIDLDFNWDRSSHEEPPNAESKAFYDMLEAADAPLWEIDINGETKVKCEKHSVISCHPMFKFEV